MQYLLDSNAVIALMASDGQMKRKARAAEPGSILLSSIVLYELMFGAFNSGRVVENLDRLSDLAFPTAVFDEHDALAAGEIRAKLKQKGTPIGPYDVMIAGQALARNLTVVTANVREFQRVAGLVIENWIDD